MKIRRNIRRKISDNILHSLVFPLLTCKFLLLILLEITEEMKVTESERSTVFKESTFI